MDLEASWMGLRAISHVTLGQSTTLSMLLCGDLYVQVSTILKTKTNSIIITLIFSEINIQEDCVTGGNTTTPRPQALIKERSQRNSHRAG